ncbi:RNA methyltransferase [Acidobacteria bacterium AB60]|nr:RNA methyltransferase [Acidobacteria bacterium AB60]
MRDLASMSPRLIQSKQNARIKELRKAFLKPGGEAKGLAAIEGFHLLEEAMRARLRVTSVFLAEDAQPLLEAVTFSSATEIFLVPRAILSSALPTETPQPVAATVEIPDWTFAHVLGARHSAPLIPVLTGLQDPGNLGTILRSAEAFGATGILALPGTVSPWNSKAVRASAGSIFRMPVVAMDADAGISALREEGVRILTTTPGAAEPADLVDLAGPIAILIGNEGKGVPANLAAHADQAVTIPCPGPVESLNAAVAASVLLYESSRQRQSATGGPQGKRGSLR